jgi:3-methyladenine DNA glycosylase AlkD
LLQYFPTHTRELGWERLERWAADLDNEELTDVMAHRVLGTWVVAHPNERMPHLMELVEGEDAWSRRLALAATTWLNRGGEGMSYPDFTLNLARQVKDDNRPEVAGALSFALRAVARQHPRQAAAFLRANQGAMPAEVVEEVVEEIPLKEEEE